MPVIASEYSEGKNSGIYGGCPIYIQYLVKL
jgi:hypothetical protein